MSGENSGQTEREREREREEKQEGDKVEEIRNKINILTWHVPTKRDSQDSAQDILSGGLALAKTTIKLHEIL